MGAVPPPAGRHINRQAALGGGGIYLTTGNRDFAAVLSPLGTVRVHMWNAATGSWKQ